MKIPSAKIYFPEDDVGLILKEIERVLISGNLTLGGKGYKFEDIFKEYNKNKFAIATSSGASALEIILRCINVENSNVVVPVNTSADTPLAVLHAGGSIRFIDCDETFCLNSEQLNEKITKETKAVIIVHIGGIIHHKINEIVKICKDRNVILIEDAAHAHGSSIQGKKAGGFGKAASFSFYPTKVITSGEGGIIVTDNKMIEQKARILRDRGKPVFNSAISIDKGSSWRMSEINAILGIFQLKRLEEFIEKRREIAKIYDKNLKGIGITPLEIKKSKTNYYKYIAMLDKNIDKIRLKEELKKREISLSGEVYSVPCHLQPVFNYLGYKQGAFPIAENLCNRHICLPIFPTLKREEVDYVISSFEEILKWI
ncbi:DegT/DnrJ/EryC1/StrS aminotransferase family protein [Candidatus Woesearchaeota archaeon]|nr:DegT/DnrJ/EryC1/StrS aminotransferase family protein [Candidatus Woesearchaeota archaeon]